MPHNNRMMTGGALKGGRMAAITGYDPYAAEHESAEAQAQAAADAELAEEYKGMLKLAQRGAAAETRGTCRICGGIGHLTFQCMNGKALGGGGAAASDSESSISSSDEEEESERLADALAQQQRASAEKARAHAKEKKRRKKEKKER